MIFAIILIVWVTFGFEVIRYNIEKESGKDTVWTVLAEDKEDFIYAKVLLFCFLWPIAFME